MTSTPDSSLHPRDGKTELLRLLAALVDGAGAYLLFTTVVLPTDLEIFVLPFTAVIVFALVSEYLQPTPPALKGATPPRNSSPDLYE